MCDLCEKGPREIARDELRLLMEYGWYAHIVMDDYPENTPTGFNYHTHGLPHSADHFDLQVVFPFPQRAVPMLHKIVGDLIALYIRKGERFEPGQVSHDIIERLPVTFAQATESGRPVLRVILPDKHGKLAPGEIDKPFDRQWKGTVPLERPLHV
jgi:hypothetical protein